MPEILTLQQAIEKKAEAELDEEIQSAVELLKSHNILHFMRQMDINVSVTYNDKKETFNSAVWSGDSTIFKLIKERLLPRRKEEAVGNFLSKVDSLEADLDELRDAIRS